VVDEADDEITLELVNEFLAVNDTDVLLVGELDTVPVTELAMEADADNEDDEVKVIAEVLVMDREDDAVADSEFVRDTWALGVAQDDEVADAVTENVDETDDDGDADDNPEPDPQLDDELVAVTDAVGKTDRVETLLRVAVNDAVAVTLVDVDAVTTALFVCTVGRADSVAAFDRAVAVGVLEAAVAVKRDVADDVNEPLEVEVTVADSVDVAEIEDVTELESLIFSVAEADDVLVSDDENVKTAV
jgi:hypothetical protein